jgi:hypothetical protein
MNQLLLGDGWNIVVKN